MSEATIRINGASELLAFATIEALVAEKAADTMQRGIAVAADKVKMRVGGGVRISSGPGGRDLVEVTWIVTDSEGKEVGKDGDSVILEYTPTEYGEADAFGHRKKMSVAEDLSVEIKAATGEETIVSDLTYDLRSGAPDFLDKLVASTFGTMAVDCVLQNKSGLMAAIVDGKYAMAAIPDPALGPRKVDVESMYNKDRYRPNYENKTGLSIFLTTT